MPPIPDLPALVEIVGADAAGDGPLDQLTQAARTVADLEEVSDELLGHFVDRCRRAGHTWSEISAALGVTKQAAHKRFSGLAPGLERFTPRAAAVVERAPDQARRLGHAYVGTEHLLLALFEATGSLAAAILADAGLTTGACEAQVLTHVHRGDRARPGRVPFTPRAVGAVRGAPGEALRLGHGYVGTEHLLLALCADPEGVAAKTLTALGVDYEGTRARVVEKLADFAAP